MALWGASLGRFLWVFLGVLVGVFLQRYFGMYLLRGISTLGAPALPRTPVRSCALLCACARSCTYVRLRAFPLARLGFPWFASISLWLRHVVPVRSCALSLALLGFPVRLRCLPLFASTRFYAFLFCALVYALVRCRISLRYASTSSSAWLSLDVLTS